MPERFWFRPSQVNDGVRVTAQCLHCLHIAGLDLQVLVDAGDRPLKETEKRLRCTSRGLNGRGPVCGGPAKLYIHAPTMRGPDGMFEDVPVLRPEA